MKRRQFITLLGGAAAWPLAARAQQQKMLRVGFVGIRPRESWLYAAFLERMTELGYQEGRNFTLEYIQTPNIEGYEKGYRELAARKVDVFLAVGNERALRAALSAAEGRPIAFLAIDFDPLAKGYVASLSQPGGNVTGIFVHQLELAAKRVEIAREVFPSAKVVGIAFDTVSREQRDAAAEAARKLGLEPRMIEVKANTATAARLTQCTTPVASRSFCRQLRCSSVTVRPSRKHCASAAFLRSRHSARIARPVC
jgi:putative tryptophan/tyrosine transport system substrate-binding protein